MSQRGKKPASRLKPVAVDSLEMVGFVSKGDRKYAILVGSSHLWD